MTITSQKTSTKRVKLGFASTLLIGTLALTSVICGSKPSMAATGPVNPPAVKTAQPATAGKTRNTNIVVESLDGFDAMQVQITIKLDGKTQAGKALRGSMNIETSYDNNADQRVLSIGGNLLSQIVGNDAQFQAFGVKKLTMYKRGEDNFISIEGKQSLCLPSKEDVSAKMDNSFSLDELLSKMSLNAGDNGFIGSLAGEEMRNGVRTLRYRLDAKAMSETMRKTGNNRTDTLDSGTLWVAKTGGHLVRLEVNGHGSKMKIGSIADFTGKLSMVINLSKFNEPFEVKVPAACLG